MPAKTLTTLGGSRQKIRVYLEDGLVRVRWREGGKRQTRSWSNSRENIATAKAFAKGIEDGRNAEVLTAPLALREIWERYSEAEFPHLREKSRKLYTEFWARWETMWGKDFVAEKTTLIMATQFRAALTKQGKAVSTIRHSLETVKMVYKWAERHELLDRNRLALYEFRLAKEEKKAPPPEYTNEEYDKLIKALNPALRTEWRAWVALTICRFQGARQNAALHLQWTDLAPSTILPTDIIWRARWDKVGDEWTQPIHSRTREALRVALEWRQKSTLLGVMWVLPAASKKNRGECYTLGALYAALRKAEVRSKVKHLKGRGGHGFRRLLAGDINAATGDPALAMMAINDDIKQADRYIQKRDDRVREAFAKLEEKSDQGEGVDKPRHEPGILGNHTTPEPAATTEE